MFINWQLHELNLKVVYYGPALSGKTTNLVQIHARIDPKRRGNLVSLKTSEDRTLYFDFLQVELGKINGLTPKIHLYTVPGQSYYEASRRLVLRGADGVVFVVDSDAKRLGDNLRAWMDMKNHLNQLGTPVTRMPIVIQFNKQDLPDALSTLVLRKMLNMGSYPSYAAVANDGQGVFDTLQAIINGVILSVQKGVVV